MTDSSSLIAGIADAHLALALPIITYWAVSLVYHLVDVYDLLPRYRLHPSAEVGRKNRVGRWECLRDVLIQQLLQTSAGLAYIHCYPVETTYAARDGVTLWVQRIKISQRGIPYLLAVIGLDGPAMATRLQQYTLPSHLVPCGHWTHDRPHMSVVAVLELGLARVINHVFYPMVQFAIAIAVIDTWQYFLHRLMHTSKWCYRNFHSRHHRLQAPYAYGALYNHPLEGFVGDTLGTGLAYFVSGMSTRQAMILFTLATVKTIDDHSGYDIPWDPFKKLTSNNAHYHNIHHQSWGMKTNFAQPFFTFWDDLMGTRWHGQRRANATVVRIK